MKTIIAGSRDITDKAYVLQAITIACRDNGFDISEVVCGRAKGVNTIGSELAHEVLMVPTMFFPAFWHIHGKSAGYKRNVQMAEYADALIAIWDGESRGTKHMIDIANKKNLKVFVYTGE